jgi:MFS family permease
MIGLAEALPALGLALYAGYVVDRSRPLSVYRGVLLGSFLSGLVLLVSQLQNAGFTHGAQVAALYIASFITGLARGFSQPSIYATVPRIVPRNELHRASAWMSSVMQVARIVGPGVGGLVFGWFGAAISAAAVCGALIVSILSLGLIRANPRPAFSPGTAPKKLPMKDELLSGVRFVFGHPILISALSLDMISVLFGGVTALLPIFAAEILMTGPKGLGLLRAAPAVGAVLMSVWMTRINFRDRAGGWLFSAVAGFGVCILVFGLSRNFALSMTALAFSGMFDSVSMVIRSSVVQLVSPDEMRGRISAVNSIFIGSSNEIGEFESGVAARFLGTVPAVVFGGVICLATVCCVAILSPPLRKLNLDQL